MRDHFEWAAADTRQYSSINIRATERWHYFLATEVISGSPACMECMALPSWTVTDRPRFLPRWSWHERCWWWNAGCWCNVIAGPVITFIQHPTKSHVVFDRRKCFAHRRTSKKKSALSVRYKAQMKPQHSSCITCFSCVLYVAGSTMKAFEEYHRPSAMTLIARIGVISSKKKISPGQQPQQNCPVLTNVLTNRRLCPFNNPITSSRQLTLSDECVRPNPPEN